MNDHLLDNLGAAAIPLEFHSAEGALVWDTGGRQYWDFYGGHAVTLIGQGHPRWVEAIERQARQLSFFTTMGSVPVRDRAARKLARFTGMDVVFFVNSGAEANEAALKIARKATGRPVVVAMEHGFHGRSMGALGVTWKYRDQHAPAYGDTRFVPFGDLAALEAAVDDTVAAIMVEPLQGIAGIVEPPPGYLEQVGAIARSRGALVVADEVQSGLGRMGVPLASKAAGLNPDLVTVGKGLGAGFPVAACLLTRAMAATVKPGEHGTTFGGAPLACAAAEATLDIIQDEGLLEKASEIGHTLRDALAGVPGIVATRGAGAWIGVVLDRPTGPVSKALLSRGFLVGTSSDPKVMRLAPPAVMPLWACRHLAENLAEILSSDKTAAA
jgi:acetylornithine/succinyldiaminopimelate/putrescine aminotransferase